MQIFLVVQKSTKTAKNFALKVLLLHTVYDS